MPDQQSDSFTLEDRKAMMLQGLHIEEIKIDVMDLKILFNESIRRNETAQVERARVYQERDSSNEKRLRSLEDAGLILRTKWEEQSREMRERSDEEIQRAKTRMQWFLALSSLIGGAVGTGVNLLLRLIVPEHHP